jgi:hypothetical protein
LDENGELLTDSHNILNRWKNYFTQLINARQIEIHAAELLVCDPGPFKFETTIPKLGGGGIWTGLARLSIGTSG